jgi:hypothetical protein
VGILPFVGEDYNIHTDDIENRGTRDASDNELKQTERFADLEGGCDGHGSEWRLKGGNAMTRVAGRFSRVVANGCYK